MLLRRHVRSTGTSGLAPVSRFIVILKFSVKAYRNDQVSKRRYPIEVPCREALLIFPLTDLYNTIHYSTPTSTWSYKLSLVTHLGSDPHQPNASPQNSHRSPP